MKALLATLIGAAISSQTYAIPFEYIKIGDTDGFGYDADPGFAGLTGDGGAADRNSDGHLGSGDVLPSLNGNMVVATGNGDDFDNRDSEGYSCVGCINTGSDGVDYTDIALSTSYNASSAGGSVYNANTGGYGSGGAFPAPPSSALTNQPGFLFDFTIADGDIVIGTDIFFNLVFGDYDVVPADIDISYATAASDTVGLVKQSNGPDDGLIQGAFVALDFYDVFTWNIGDSTWDGYVEVDFDAPNEPYTAFDYVELSTAPFTIDVVEPNSLALMLFGLMGVGMARRKQKG
ncbi:hypothetical protein A9Q99_00115 [Gammaproteobacteria bacterium 45_16_T64]|nr:hypothetical protein A9Q99_00115 [Gammaproteobacteria bacterium 45_16_T64]